MRLRYSVIALLLCTCFAQLAPQQEILRPTTDIDPGPLSLGCNAAQYIPSTAMPLSYDSAGLTTFSLIRAFGTDQIPRIENRLFSTWQTTGNTYSSLVLNVNAVSFGNQGDAPASSCIKYSTDGGATYTTLKCEAGGGYPQQTFTATLSATQLLNKLRVGVCVEGNKGSTRQGLLPGDDQVSMYDIWTVGTNGVPPSGNGSNLGQPHRGVAVTN